MNSICHQSWAPASRFALTHHWVIDAKQKPTHDALSGILSKWLVVGWLGESMFGIPDILRGPFCYPLPHLLHPISRLPSPISHLSSLVSCLLSFISHLSSLVSRLSSLVSPLSSLISHLSATVSHLPSSPRPSPLYPSPLETPIGGGRGEYGRK